MDIYRRVEALATSNEEKMTDSEFFLSAEFKSYLERKLQNIVTGTAYYLGLVGINVTKREEAKLIRSINVVINYDISENSKTAFFALDPSSGKKILMVNAGNRLIQVFQSRKEKFWGVLGMFYHELGHALFTDFPTTINWNQRLTAGQWMPSVPENVLSGKYDEIDTALRTQDTLFLKALVLCANSVDNCVEDGYIENEIKAMFPGMASRCLATLNVSLIEGLPSLSDEEKSFQEKGEELPEFAGIMGQTLMYAKFGEMNLGSYNGPLLDPLLEIVDIIDASNVLYERCPEKRKASINELLCVLFPYMNAEIERIKKELEKNNQSEESLPQKIADQLNSMVGSMGGSGSSGNGQPDQGQTTQGLGKSMTNSGQTSGSRNTAPGSSDSQAGQAGQSGGAGSNQGSDQTLLDAAERDMESIQKNIANNAAMEQAEEERTKELTKEANEFEYDSSLNGRIIVTRAAVPSEESIKKYDKVAEEFVSAGKDLQRGIKAILKDRKERGKMRNLPFGRRLEVASVVHNDGKYFSKNKATTEPPQLSVGVLVDESGSVTQDLSDASVGAALVIEEFCRGLNIPLIVNGYTTNGMNGVNILSYAELNEIDSGNKYRITGMSSRGGTPTTKSLVYMINKMKKINSDIRLLLVITDGQSGDNCNDMIKSIISKAERESFVVIAAGIGRNRKDVHNEFGEKNFLDISNIKEMPTLLLDIVKNNFKF